MTTDTHDQRFQLDRLRSALRAKNRHHGDVKLFRDVKGELFAGRMHVGTDQACILNDSRHLFSNVLIQGCEFTVEGPCDWGLQLYNVEDLVVRHCWFHDFTAPKLDGHAVYLRAHGNVLFEHGLTQRCFGQGIQSAKRAAHHGGTETLDATWFERSSTFTVRDWTFEDCSIPGGKHAGFALSFFEFQDDSGPDAFRPRVGQHVELVDVRVVHSIGGAQLVVQGGPNGHPSFSAAGCVFDYPDSEGRGEVAIVRFVPTVALRDFTWNGGKVKLYVQPGDSVNIAGGSGNAPLWAYEHELDDKGARRLKKLHKLSMREGFEFGVRMSPSSRAEGGAS